MIIGDGWIVATQCITRTLPPKRVANARLSKHLNERYVSNTSKPVNNNDNQAEKHNQRLENSKSTAGTTSTSSASEYLLRKQDEFEEEDGLLDVRLRQLQQVQTTGSDGDVPWIGDEALKDTILRMLVDKHKPLRVAGSNRKVPESLTKTDNNHLFISSNDTSEPKQSLNNNNEGVKYPWDYDKKPTNHDSVKPNILRMPKSSPNPHKSSSSSSDGSKSGAKYEMAREAKFDYADSFDVVEDSDGVVKKRKKQGQDDNKNKRTPIPTSPRALHNLVEERIETARRKGHFRNIQGAGSPFKKDIHDHNPFIDRTEKLLNRMVQRQGAAPPWVELQRETENAILSFRKRIRESWYRRCIRIFSSENVSLNKNVVDKCVGFRDFEWEKRERGYHNESIRSVNELIRKYNILAPLSVRKNFLKLENELETCFDDMTSIIQEELNRRMKNVEVGSQNGRGIEKVVNKKQQNGDIIEQHRNESKEDDDDRDDVVNSGYHRIWDSLRKFLSG